MRLVPLIANMLLRMEFPLLLLIEESDSLLKKNFNTWILFFINLRNLSLPYLAAPRFQTRSKPSILSFEEWIPSSLGAQWPTLFGLPREILSLQPQSTQSQRMWTLHA